MVVGREGVHALVSTASFCLCVNLKGDGGGGGVDGRVSPANMRLFGAVDLFFVRRFQFTGDILTSVCANGGTARTG